MSIGLEEGIIMQSKYYNSNMRNNIISALVVTLISFFIAVLMENISVFVFAILSWMIVICIDNFLFKNYEKHVNTLLLIWILYMGGILWIYYAEKHVYGAPYMMSDDYRMETEWVKECLEKKCYTIRQMVRRSSFFNVANCNAHILFLAY